MGRTQHDNEASRDDASSSEDGELLERFQQGDEMAFMQLVTRYEKRLVAYLYQIVRDLELSRDICQDVFLKLIDAPPVYQHEASIRGWLFQVARNKAVDQLRRQKYWSDDQEAAATATEERPSPSECARAEDDRAEIHRLVAGLPIEMRDVLCLRMFGRQSFKEIAAIMNIPLGTALWRMQQALRLLRREWEGEPRRHREHVEQ